MKLSLIIPIYRVEQYILSCLQSICMQLPRLNIEILLINDGSPDHSIQIAQEFLTNQSIDIQKQFKWFHQKNAGVSAARNLGIKHAQGEYIAFLDSDDMLNDSFFTTILNIINTEPCPDLIQFCADRVTDDGEVFPFLIPLSSQGYQPLNHNIQLKVFNRCAWFPWLRVYKKELFESIEYPVGQNYEDAYTIPFLFLKAKTIYFTDAVLVQYRMNPTGITASKSLKNLEDLEKTLNHYLDYVEIYPILTPSIIALSQFYITDSFYLEGSTIAGLRWVQLKEKMSQAQIEQAYILNRGNRLFYRYGIWFLKLEKYLKCLGLKK